MSTRTAYDRALSLEGRSASGFVLVALAAHLAGALFVSRHARAASVDAAPVTTEIEFVAPPPPEPAPEPEVRDDRVATVAPVAAKAPAAARPSAPLANAPAKAGAVITASPGAEGPVSFVTDPDGGEYGSGVVSINGSGNGGGVAAPKPSSAPAAPPRPPPPPLPKKLATPPRLVNANACRGFFPTAAEDDAATVAVVVTVTADGTVTAANVASESPKGQGFGTAARACVLAQRFVPATGEDGVGTGATATVNVHFSR